LEWRFDQGQAEITVDFAKDNRKALVVSTYQMMLLLVFNSFKLVTYKQLLDVTGIPKSEVANHLLSLCHPRVGVLLKRPNTKLLADTDKFMINPKYTNPLRKVTIPLLRAVDTEENSEEENKTIELQRRHQMDAAIVRIMVRRHENTLLNQQTHHEFLCSFNVLLRAVSLLCCSENAQADASQFACGRSDFSVVRSFQAAPQRHQEARRSAHRTGVHGT
jgi:hypothetical protein